MLDMHMNAAGIERELRRIADCLERAFPAPAPALPPVKKLRQLEDVMVTDDSHLVAIEEEEDRVRMLAEGDYAEEES